MLKVKEGAIQAVAQVDATVEVSEGMVEEDRGKDTPLFHAIGDVKGRRGVTV